MLIGRASRHRQTRLGGSVSAQATAAGNPAHGPWVPGTMKSKSLGSKTSGGDDL